MVGFTAPDLYDKFPSFYVDMLLSLPGAKETIAHASKVQHFTFETNMSVYNFNC